MKMDQPWLKVDAVRIEHKSSAVLDLHFKVINKLTRKEESDCITFTCTFPGKEGITEDAAKQACSESAYQWAQFKRLEGFEVSAWDDCGNSF